MITILGPSSSSTRTELLGIITASLAPIPVCCALDNSAATNKGQDIILILRQNANYHTKQPYELTKDRDLWTVFNECVKSRGPVTISLLKVKGHASLTDDATEAIQRDKHGNDRTDLLATTANRDLHGRLITDISNYIHARAIDSIQYMKAIHAIIFALQIAEQGIRSTPAFQQQHPRAETNQLITIQLLAIPTAGQPGRYKIRVKSPDNMIQESQKILTTS